MPDRTWRLQDAKARFSALVDAAVGGEAQHVTRRGRAAVVVVGADAFERMRHAERGAAPGFIEHLIGIPKTAARGAVAAEPKARPVLHLRDIDFS